ncbi:uncharacterized protein LOC131041425 isoform X1 [Cryptomeria japonica]|uniref:uncharacterized protein LOC131041425 isoform X1 n=1 Tax=Cryptomeria japonica TaxID=3369 RepID=UPI0027D9D378|nr:uncharacterized protein LOC131041425 isoform X1 [Cryptomeria japonica]XP_057830495.2 uncharacterized protein LOC131041425 isoform X1 [Cryptomeria japonica]
MWNFSRVRMETTIVGVALVLLFLNFLHPLVGVPKHFHSFSFWAPTSSTNVDKMIVVYVTTPTKEIGKDMANSIISSRLAACVNQVSGVESTYWWNGKVVVDTEVLLIIKTRDSLFNTLTKHVKALHPYKVPEIIAVPITEGSEDYMQWMKENTAVLNG